jgi:hypothetical protein
MRQRNPTKAVHVLDLLLEFFADGQHWTRCAMDDGQGNRCLVGALRYIRRRDGIKGDGAADYLTEAVMAAKGSHFGLIAYNDYCDGFHQIRAIIVAARKAAKREAAVRQPVTAEAA